MRFYFAFHSVLNYFYNNHSVQSLKIVIALIIGFWVFPFQLSAQTDTDIIISEIMASNSQTASDEDFDYPDWIELYNRGEQPVNLKGWGLSDDEEDLFRWVFPEVNIQPGEYLIVWASNKDRRPSPEKPESGIVREVFSGIPGSSVNDLLSSSDYPHNPSSREIVKTSFEAPVDVADNYGQRMHGLLKAPQTGEYKFWISGDDNSQLFLSTNETEEDQTLIAEVPEWTSYLEWDKFPEQESESVFLEEGQFYHITALMKEGQGGDNLSVRWRMPDGTDEAPMSGHHVYRTDSELHANFAIASDGEPVILTNAEGQNIQFINPVSIPTDVSYGIPDGGGTFLFFDNPTPGEKNPDSGKAEIINEKPEFSHQSGFYTAPFDLTISSGIPDSEIYYTLDGSEPDPDNVNGKTYSYSQSYPTDETQTRQIQTHQYNVPIEIKDRTGEAGRLAGINTFFSSDALKPADDNLKGTVVKAKIIKDNAISEETATFTYFVTDEGAERYNLPVISIVTDESGLFDYENGIYVPGKVADDWFEANNYSGWNDGRPANYNQRGEKWERPAHFEFFDGGIHPKFSQGVGLRIHGGWTRAYPQKSLRIYARNTYNSNNWLEYPLLGELPARGNPEKTVNSFKRLILRNSGNDNDATMYRDALIQSLVSHLPIDVQGFQPAVHFINGEFWGITNIRERLDQFFIESHYGIDANEVTILEVYGNINTGDPSDRDQFLNVVTYAEDNDLSIDRHYRWITKKVDTENLATYYAIQIYLHNTDWPQNNMTFWRKQTNRYYENAPQGHDGRWRWMLYDTDFGMNLNGSNDQVLNSLERVMDPNTSDPSSKLFRELMDNDQFQNYFINLLNDQLNTSFKPERISEKVDEFNALFSGVKNEHYRRWWSGTDEGDKIKNFGRTRPDYILSHIQDELDAGNYHDLTVTREGSGGAVKVNSVLIDEFTPGVNPDSPFPWSGTYMEDVPVNLKALSSDGYRFSHWISNDTEVEDSTATHISVSINQNTNIKAVFKEERQELVHYWNFNSLPDGNLSPFTSNFSQTNDAAILSYSGSGDGYMDRVNDGTEINTHRDAEPERALRVRNPSHSRDLILTLPTTGFEDVTLNYAVKRTPNGAEIQDVYYRTEEDGSWQKIMDNLLISEEYQLVEVDFSEISEADNNKDFAIKIDFSGITASESSGNNRFDNISLEGYPTLSTGQNLIQKEARTQVFPVPASETIHVESEYKIGKIVMYEPGGKMVKTMLPEQHNHSFNISNLPSGVYFLEITTSAGPTTKKVVVTP